MNREYYRLHSQSCWKIERLNLTVKAERSGWDGICLRIRVGWEGKGKVV